ncbi:hypothetical protein ACOMHN_015866 [Nucella lapillus]
MGSGSSSQVKTIHDTAVTNSATVRTGKETTTSSKSITRALSTDPNMPVTAYTNKETVAPAAVKLNESESEKLDLQDRIQALEERLQEVTSAATVALSSRDGGSKTGVGSRETTASDLQETLHAKDLYIQQMEGQLVAAEDKSKKGKIRLRKKIKNLTAQLNEAKQESSIAQLELKERNKDLQEQLVHSTEGGMTAMASRIQEEDEGDKDSKMKVILDLSAEVFEQSHQIQTLDRRLKEKDKEIERLKGECSRTPKQTVQPIHSEHSNPSVRSQPGRSSFSQQGSNSRHMRFTCPSSHSGVPPVETVKDYNTPQGIRPISKIGPRHGPGAPYRIEEELMLQRQSTALSDSDSDWEMDATLSKIHSAPARVRVKSAASSAQEALSDRVDGDDRWSVATDDNDLTMTSES